MFLSEIAGKQEADFELDIFCSGVYLVVRTITRGDALNDLESLTCDGK